MWLKHSAISRHTQVERCIVRCKNITASERRLGFHHHEKSFSRARERYADLGEAEVDRALKILATIPIPLPCWQGDDYTPDRPVNFYTN